MRYLGQTHEVSVPVVEAASAIGEGLDETFRRFHTLHEQLYTFNKPDDEIEILSVHLDLVGVRKKPSLPSLPIEGADPSAALRGTRPVYSFPARGYVDTPVYEGERVRPGNRIEGPAIIEEARTSIVLFEGQSAILDAFGNYVVEVIR